MPTESSPESVWYAVGLIGTGVLAAVKSYFDGHASEGAGKKKGQLALLETGELVDLNALRTICNDLKPLLERLYARLEMEREDREEDKAMIKRIYDRVERMDNEMEVNRRVQDRLHRRED